MEEDALKGWRTRYHVENKFQGHRRSCGGKVTKDIKNVQTGCRGTREADDAEMSVSAFPRFRRTNQIWSTKEIDANRWCDSITEMLEATKPV